MRPDNMLKLCDVKCKICNSAKAVTVQDKVLFMQNCIAEFTIERFHSRIGIRDS